MAIAFARLEYVKRSNGKNACAKAAYNSRDRIEFEGHKFGEARIYNWSHGQKVAYHEMLLPDGVDSKFQSPQILWNSIEQIENRKNSQVAAELLLALPDDPEVSLDDKIEMSKRFLNKHFVARGFAVQIDIHPPGQVHAEGEVGSKDDDEHEYGRNWHLHALITLREFSEDGSAFKKHKLRDLMAEIRLGKAVLGTQWGKLWGQEQNAYFEEKGMALRVDMTGAVGQKHLGPVRMRGNAASLMEEHSLRLQLNALESLNPKRILEKIIETQNIFSHEDLDRYLKKHVQIESISKVKEEFWQEPQIVQLLDRISGQPLNKYTTKEVLEEEAKILRIADRIAGRKAYSIAPSNVEKATAHLKSEQLEAFKNIAEGKRLCCLNGWAGTGKSHVLASLKNAYETEGYTVRGFGPDNATANVLKNDHGFKEAENIYKFLFKNHHHKKSSLGGEEVWILDEAGKLGSRPFLEFLKLADRVGAQIVLSGDVAQMPSVERGRMFQAIIDRFGAQTLSDIQRQRTDAQRAIAKELAVGNISKALDAIATSGGFHWSSNKTEAFENLINRWASDRNYFPDGSTIILAHSNWEIRLLNELVREYRKERGELGCSEFLCETVFGKILVSEGDWIEFRLKDENLKVKNGLKGVLTELSESRFIVSVKEGSKLRQVEFDPREYTSWHLGYATTNYRTQGSKSDRVYVLWSPMLNREATYVALTRHVHSVACFVAKEEVGCLSDLKRLAYRQSQKEVTQNYTTSEELAQQQEKDARRLLKETLKSSDSIVARLKGQALQAVDIVQNKTSGWWQKIADRKPDQAFFQWSNESLEQAKVKITKFPARPEDDIKPVLMVDRDRSIAQTYPTKAIAELNRSTVNSKNSLWIPLPEKSKKLIRDYYDCSDLACSLHAIVKAEAESNGIDERLTQHFQQWQQACGKRNNVAHDVANGISESQLRILLKGASFDTLKYRAARHEAIVQSKTNIHLNVENSLRDNLDGLLLRLFPEGPTRRDSRSYRFGSKCSLSVAYRGEKAGSFFDFEKGEGGGLIKLIASTLGVNHKQATDWAKEFLNAPIQVEHRRSYGVSFLETKNSDSWVSLMPASDMPAPPLATISKCLDQKYREVGRHAYKDGSGQLLFYNLRLVEKDGSQKSILPLSYGYYKGGEETPKWSLKGFQAEKRTLYNLDILQSRPSARVLIVEGEKTADAANRLFGNENIVAVTWLGGAAAVGRADWTTLAFRDVIIWPDNDEPGFKACDAISSSLRRVGVNSLKVVNKETLRNTFTEKWDLADDLPHGLSQQRLADLLTNANDRAVGISELLVNLPTNVKKHPMIIPLAKEVLWRVEERMRPSLEVEHGGKTWEIQNRILAEAVHILSKSNHKAGTIQRIGVEGEIWSSSFNIAMQIFEASRGTEPSLIQREELRKTMKDVNVPCIEQTPEMPKIEQREVREFVIGKYLGTYLERGMPGFELKDAIGLQKEALAISGDAHFHKALEKLPGYAMEAERSF